MIAFPNIKINLGLSITEKRPDGYHNLETVFYPVALEDALEIRTSPNADRKFTLHQHGMEIAGNPEDNLVVKAYLLMDKEFHLPPVEIHLYKHIPSGAGLGGGSSDAAFMLKLLNDHYQLGVSEEQLEVYAATLGDTINHALDSNTTNTVGILTNDFHMFRAMQIARAQKIPNTYGISCGSTKVYLPNNMFREYFAEIKFLLKQLTKHFQ